MTTPRYSFDMKYLNQGIWAIGGTGGSGSKNTMDYFDMTSNVWTKHSLPFSVSYHCLTKINEHQLILLGGYQGGATGVNNEMKKYINQIISIHIFFVKNDYKLLIFQF